MNQPPLPVTVLSGLPGAGKTTLLDHLVANQAPRRIATIVARSLEAHDAQPPSAHLLDEVRRVAASGQFDAIVIEVAGSADPEAIAEAFIFDDDAHDDHEHTEACRHDDTHTTPLSDLVRLDTMVTVIDAANFLRDHACADALSERGFPDTEDDERTVVEVLIQQVEFSDVFVINKIDLVTSDELTRLERILARLNPHAVQYTSRFAEVTPDHVLDTQRFDFDTTSSGAGWLAILDQDRADTKDSSIHSDAEADVGYLVYRARRPFHPQRLWALLHEEWQGVLRSKGFFWLATRNDHGGSLSQAGGACRHGPAGMWWAAQDRSEWPQGDDELIAEIVADWYGEADDPTVGDRRQELVLIGEHLDASAWQKKFDACLLNEAEFAAGADTWQRYPDPFPEWDFDDDHDHDHDHGDDDPHHHHGHHHH